MATETPGNYITRLAGANLSGKSRYLAKLDGSNKAVLATAATDKIVGVIDEAPQGATGALSIKSVNSSGTGKVKVGAAIPAGTYLTAGAAGKAVAAVQTTAGQQPSVRVFGRSVEASSAEGDVIEFEHMNFLY